MAQTPEKYSHTEQYTAPTIEWAALLTLAAEPSPAQAVIAGGWQEALFASAEAGAAFGQLAAAESPMLLDLPAAHDDIEAITDPRELAGVREQLVAWAQARQLAALQAQLARHLRSVQASRDVESVAALVSAALGAIEQTAELRHGGHAAVEMVTLGELAATYWQRVEEHRDAMPTGLAQLDRALGGGLQAQRLVVLLGAPGSGKTTLANQIAEHIAHAGRPVVYLTMEDTPATLLAKTLARIGGIEYGQVLQGREAQRGMAITAALEELAQRQSAQRLLYVEDGALMLSQVRDLARAHLTRYDAEHGGHGGGAGVLVVDYLQRWARGMRDPGISAKELRERVSWLTEQLRTLARELNCCVLALASQNRASGYGRASGDALATAKESGDIEYTADVILAIADDANDKRDVALKHEPRMLQIAKNRLGETRKIEMDWYPSRQIWTEAVK